MRNITLATLFIFLFTTVAFAAAPFSDVKASHWAYDAISKLAAKGYIEGYKDGTFKGEKNLTRYELAMVISRLIDKFKGMGGVSPEDLRTLEKLTVEFSDELALLGVKVTALEDEMKMVKSDVASLKNNGAGNGKINLSGEFGITLQSIDREFDTRGDDDWFNHANFAMNMFMNVDEDVTAFVRYMNTKMDLNNLGTQDEGAFDEAFIDVKNFFKLGDLRIGRQWMSLGHSIVLDDKMDGIKFSKVMDQVAFTMFAFSTRAASAVNDQFYGDSTGQNNYYMFSDAVKGSAAVAGTILTPGTDAITLYTTPYAGAQPMDNYTGSMIATPKTHLWNDHTGAALNGGYINVWPNTNTSLAPVNSYLGAAVGVRPALTAYTQAGLGAADSTTTTLAQNAATVLTRDYQMTSAAGLDSFGINVSVDFGGHALAGYYLQRDYDKYDPYTQLGDPWAAMVDYNNDGVVDWDAVNNCDLSPAANPTYWGITLDGNILRNLDYFFEYVSFDADINNIGVNPLTGSAVTAAGTAWNGNNLDDGNAWLLGLDWDLTDDLNLIVQYGVGDEEFVPASIYKSEYLNGMQGRYNSGGQGLLTFNDNGVGEGTGALTGVKDLLIKFSADFNDKTSGYIKYEVCEDNDSSAARLIAGDPSVTGHLAQDYKLFTLRFKHIYKPNTVLGLQYDYMKYDNDNVNNAHSIGGNEAYVTDDINWGGWQRITADVQVKF